MKKFFAVIILLAVLCSCSAKEPKGDFCSPAPIENGDERTFSEEETEDAKIILALPHFIDEKIDMSAGIEPTGKRVDIPFPAPENAEEAEANFDISLIPEEVFDEIKTDYPDFEPRSERWAVSLNYYASDLSAGLIKMIYMIGDKIETNKAVVCSVENGKIVRINYTNMDMSTDEKELIRRVLDFENTTIQTKKTFEEGEEFISEDFRFVYYYNVDILTYCYQLFFYEDTPLGKVINNDYFSEYIIE